MAEQVRNINPEVGLRVFSEGVTDENIDAFLKDVDLYVDASISLRWTYAERSLPNAVNSKFQLSRLLPLAWGRPICALRSMA